MDARQIHQFIFDAGLSTASQVTKVSGRGIGMDVVRSKVAEIGGRLAVRSKPGEGTTITINLPDAFGPKEQVQDGTSRSVEAVIGRMVRRSIAA
jgi:two-component system chemotaxis sensor kinase CheA